MRCLIGEALGSTADQVRAEWPAIQKQGAAFVYVKGWREWIIVARDIATKRRLVRRYRRGMMVCTVQELPAAADPFVREMVEMFGAEVER